jgi:6-phosphogluconolactonase (cycloisomerase 2 family)
MSPATVAAGRTPAFVTVDPSGRFAYVANAEDNNISQYTIGADGKLTPMSPATVGAGSTPTSVTVDPSGRFAYVTNWWADRPSFHFGGSDNVSQYAIGSDGKLTPMSPATVEAGVGPNSIVIDPSGRFAYVVNAYRDPVTDYIHTNNVSQYTVGADGKLTPMFPASVSTGLMPYQVKVDPEGRFVYVANYWDDNISQYKIGVDGKLTQLSPAKVPAGNGPYSVAVDPNGWFAYVANRHDNNVTQYAIGVDGKLTPMSPAIVPAGHAPAFITTTGSVR